MRRGTGCWLVAALVGLGWPSASGAEIKAEPLGAEGWIFIDEGISTTLMDEPAHHFHLAREDLARGEPKAAALEIRKGEAYLKIEASRAVEDARPALLAAARGLERLADRVEQGQVTTPQALARPFARAHQALARHHYLKASQFQTHDESNKVWHDLQAATVHLEAALDWAGAEVAAGALQAAEEARALGDRVKGGATWTRDEVGRAIEALGLEIDRLGKQLDRDAGQ